jgi:ribosomal protein S18 acetylase RimI-like enzyme
VSKTCLKIDKIWTKIDLDDREQSIMSIHDITIRKATISEDLLIAKYFYQLWLDNGVTPDSIRTDSLEITIKFIAKARQELSFQAFVAIVDGKIVGSASCQIFTGLYPWLFASNSRQYGYIWNVYVESDYRRLGIATQLTKATIAYLRSLECTHAILHASPYGKELYESLGFIPKNEMILALN